MSMRNLYISFAFCILLHLAATGQTYTLINDATRLSGSGYYQLTSDTGNQGGGVYYNDSINLNSSFDYKFCVFLGCNGNGADGICFILSNNITSIGANNGGGMGYGGLAGNSLAVEYDTWQNPWDPNNYHMAMEWGGQVQHPTGTIGGPVCALIPCTTMADCNWHTTELVWNAEIQTYSAYFDGVLRITYTGDVVGNFFGGNPVVNWGWSGSSGNTAQQFCILSLSNTTGISSVAAGPDIKISPNPNQGNFTVSMSSTTMLNGTMSVVDQLGRTLNTQNIEVNGTKEVPLELGDISPGVYLLFINSGATRTVKQFVVR